MDSLEYWVEEVKKTYGEVKMLVIRQTESIIEYIGSRDDYSLNRITSHFERCLDYNVLNGKMTRGATVPLTVFLVSRESQDLEIFHQACMVGVALEMVQASFLVLDDIMDNSTTRRNKPCWYLAESKAHAINDGLFLENSVYCVIRKVFQNSPSKMLDILNLMSSTILSTVVGQSLDVDTLNFPEDFTEPRYLGIVRAKTAGYSFLLPIQLGLVIADQQVHLKEDDTSQLSQICMRLGEYFQIQDDFLDCFGDAEILGKKGTDIEEGKATWLVIQALKHGSNDDRATLEAVFKKTLRDSADVQAVKQVYLSVGIPKIFQSYEQEARETINVLLDSLDKEFLKVACKKLFEKIHKRQK
jgi:farnesyl diphosphate synthase